ncbi:MAG: hypothetical protein JST92_21345 [Deltaproteobacteria bacterium]|nr:hypothetical protein [Deltaproteobacteria bacterium]
MSQLSLPFLTTREAPQAHSDTRAAPPSGPRLERSVSLEEPRPHLAMAARLAEGLQRMVREPVEVELTDNAWTMVSYRRVEGRLRFRLHHMFGAAGDDVITALAGFTGHKRKQHGRTIDLFVKQNRALIRSSPERDDVPLTTRGRVHDLREIYDDLNRRHFDGRIDARIGWGRKPPGRRRRSIKMGVYLHDRRLIRLHPALDDEQVPRLFVELVVFHEMLHQHLPPTEGASGRRCVHGPEFRAAERKFPGYEQARAWEKAHLHLLLRRS